MQLYPFSAFSSNTTFPEVLRYQSGLILHRSILDTYSTILFFIPEKSAAILNLCQVTVYPCLFITVFTVWFSFFLI